MRMIAAMTIALIITGACGGGDDAPSTTRTPTRVPDGATEIAISAQNNAFSRSEIEVDAEDHLLIHFTNRDAAPHNVAFYATDAAEEEIYVGETIRGPGETVDYEFDAPARPGEYFFRCDVHPIVMTGTLIVR
jgi:plastocyanin